MEKFCDLHTHSNYSDGTLTPPELLKKAEECGLSAIALTDHNTITGLNDFLNAGKTSTIETIPGVEFSTTYKRSEYHILALFVKPEHYNKITDLFKKYDDLKEESNLDLINKLKNAGMEIDYKKIKNQTPNGRLNRANIALEMVNKGYISSVEEGFKTILSKTYGFYVEPPKPGTIEIIKFIKSIGAVSVFAHPLLNHTLEDLHDLLPKAKEAGLDAIEVYYSTYTDEETKIVLDLANKYNLLYSGGSDFHGETKPDISLKVGRGNLNIPYEFLTELKKLKK